MRQSGAVALSVGLLVWAWTFVSFSYLEPHVLTWVTFLSWASFYATGGGPSGLAKSIASGIVGVLVSAAVMWVHGQLNLGTNQLLVLSMLLGVLGWTLCTVSTIRLLGCIPANFIGASAFFGSSAPLDIGLVWVLCSIVVGAFLGIVSQKLATALTRPDATAMPSRVQERESTRPS